MDSCSYFVKCNSNSRVQFLKVSSSFSVLKNGTENNEIMFYDIGLDVKELTPILAPPVCDEFEMGVTPCKRSLLWVGDSSRCHYLH
ncbi:hypothetical protein L1887_26075 [Cichorium endivia]|nr:hypothetical protein L1887_26075 [Cichorium endivia]